MSAKRSKPKFRAGTVVVYQEWENGKLVDDRTIKLVNRSLDYKSEPQWEDMWSNYYPESQLRPLTAREQGPRRKSR